MTQYDLARATGRHPATVGLAERCRVSFDMARRCAAVLGCKPEDLIEAGGQP